MKSEATEYHSLTFTKFWKIRCLEMDVRDYLESGDVEMLEFALLDLPLIKKVLKQEIEKARRK